ncbi:MAG: enoyl-CoA hydratase/isomerase family protein [Syntrophorhabdales bacterium]|jgi:2-(1,2-epoxy-1,2-dihydrophenyl)acetyl-CoA isomerase
MGVVTEAFHDGVYHLTLNRPDKKNAMSEELLEALYHSLQRAEKEAAPIVVIRGAGKTFCSGGDVIEFKDSEEPGIKIDAMADFLNRGITLIRTMPAIVIAVVEGLAFGAGLSLSCACDFTLAEEKAVMNMAYRRIGLTPDGGGSIFLSRLVGMKRFSELYFLSRNIGMEEARQMGIVNFVVGEGELEARLAALIEDLLALPFETTRKLKELVNLSLLGGLGPHLDRERLYVSQFSAEPEFQERLKRLFKKGS